MAVLERDYRIDGIKWLLIVLVTFGHVRGCKLNCVSKE